MTLTVGSLFSGVGGFDLGFERAGMAVRWQCENNPAARGVLRRHWPDVTVYEDVRDVGIGTEPVDILMGGFPCQDVSIAGRRAGLAGERSGLWFEFHRILGELAPQWVVIENVPGLLSSNGGRDFATILHGLVELRYGVVWRVLDSRHFGVPQRRRRVFVVGHLGAERGRAAEVLFEREGGGGADRARGSAREGDTGAAAHRVIGSLYASGAETARTASAGNELDFVVAFAQNQREEVRMLGNSAGAIPAEPGTHQQTYVIKGAAVVRQPHNGPQYGEVLNDGSCYTLNTTEVHAISFEPRYYNRGMGGPPSDVTKTLKATDAFGGDASQHVAANGAVRRLTPLECERLQGFPDGWTAGQSDAARYRQMGNAVTVNVAEWIGRRIVEAAQS